MLQIVLTIGHSYLAIQGQEDQYGTLAQIDEIEARYSPLEVAILEQCGHAPHLNSRFRLLLISQQP